MPALATIKNRRDFLAATARGRRIATGSFVLQARAREDGHPAAAAETRIGYTVTKKMGNAVVRNRIKRRLREAVKALPPALPRPGYDYVIIARSKAFDCDFSELARELEFAFSRIHAKKNA